MASVNVISSWLASTARLGNGLFARGASHHPEKLLELYEFEACPFCRMVRDALTSLDLDARIYPCPKGGSRFRSVAEARGGKAQFPFLVDPNTGAELYESQAIIDYLFMRYADGNVPLFFRMRPINTLSSGAASLLRQTRGGRARPSRAPAEPLELWSFEESPYCRLVRERLCELELPYVLHNVGKGRAAEMLPMKTRRRLGLDAPPSTAHRRTLAERAGRVQVPYLYDPNTGFEQLESAAINDYLDRTYALG